MRNTEVVNMFMQGRVASTLHLTSTGDKLISYSTCIAEWDGPNCIVLNETKYSVTTSRHLGYLKRCIPKYMEIIRVVDVKKGSPKLIIK